jgi:hypothetical protein
VEYSHLDNTPGADLARGFAYNPATSNLLLVSRDGGASVRVLNGSTGAETGTLNLGAGVISGGTFTGNMIAAADDGAIYMCNLASPTTANFKVYRWANEVSTPTLAFSSTTVSTGRLGDDFDAIGSGSATLLLAGESNSTGVDPRNGFVVLNTADGVNFSGTRVGFAGSPPTPGDFRLGITFLDTDTVMGAASSGQLRLADFSGATGTLVDSTPTASAAERPMDYVVAGGMALLATIDTNSSLVRVYDMTDPNNPVLLATANNTSATVGIGGFQTNGSGLGQVKWGAFDGTNIDLYAMSSNQGIQAFVVTIPEPGAASVLGLLCGGMLLLRRRR